LTDTGPAFVVHTVDHARAVLAAAEQNRRPVTLVTPPGACAYLGLPYLNNMIAAAADEHPGASFNTVLDAGDDAAIAHTALTLGWRTIAYQGPTEVRAKLVTIASRTDGKVAGCPPSAHDLQDDVDPAAAIEDILPPR
jgi:fructose/tagatose bisphosphate aldolase